MAVKKPQFLLMIEGPCYAFPIGVFPTDQEALEAAVELGLRNEKNPDQWPEALFERVDGIPGGIGIVDLGISANYLPGGYAIYRIGTNGVPTAREEVVPFTSRPVVTQGTCKAEQVDPEQTFAWND